MGERQPQRRLAPGAMADGRWGPREAETAKGIASMQNKNFSLCFGIYKRLADVKNKFPFQISGYEIIISDAKPRLLPHPTE